MAAKKATKAKKPAPKAKKAAAAKVDPVAASAKTETPKAEAVKTEAVKTEAAKPEIKADVKAETKAAPKATKPKSADKPKLEAKAAAPAPAKPATHVATKSEAVTLPGAVGFFSTSDLNKEFETMTRESMQYVEDVTAQTKAGVDAVIASSTIFAKGVEELTRAMMSFTQTTLEDQVKAGQTLLGAKTLREFTEVQSGLTRDALDRAMAEATRISELSLKTANDAAAPITEQVNASIKAFSAKAV